MLKTEVNTYIGKKGIQSTMILKKARIFKNQNNFLTLKLLILILTVLILSMSTMYNFNLQWIPFILTVP